MRLCIGSIKVVIFTLSLVTSFAHATNLWQQNSAMVGINEHWGVFSEFQPRWLDGLDHKQALILRGAVLYRLSPEVRLGFGAAWVPQYLPTQRDEKRIFQQFDYLPGGDVWISAFRMRFEQRYLERTLGTTFRIRGKAQLSWMPGQYGAYLWDEIFFHLNGKSKQVLGGFDQNRLSVGPRAQVDWLMIEAGYLLQTLRRVSGVIHSDHGASLSLVANLW